MCQPSGLVIHGFIVHFSYFFPPPYPISGLMLWQRTGTPFPKQVPVVLNSV